MILAHRHGDAWSDPGHRADGGNKPEANDTANDAAAVLAENVFTGDQANFELAAHFRPRRGQQKNCVQQNVESDDNARSEQERTRNSFVPAS